ncbi:hypothetical protein GCM10027258_81930 [Amycolatopsis stemonae]
MTTAGLAGTGVRPPRLLRLFASGGGEGFGAAVEWGTTAAPEPSDAEALQQSADGGWVLDMGVVSETGEDDRVRVQRA